MEFEIEFDTGSDIATIRTRGVADAEGFNAYLTTLVSDPRWHPGMSTLTDHTALDAGHITAADVEKLVDVHSRFAEAIGHGLSAIVTGSSLKFGLARMFEAHAEERLPNRLRIFATADEALSWLRASEKEPESEPRDRI
ncbi:MAG: hypothetical protein WBQ14_09635 [Gaiellaceae bacterium]